MSLKKVYADPSIVTSGLVLYLDASNASSYAGSGTSWFDLSGNSNTGTLTNGPTFSSANGGSIVFDGTNDYVDTSVKLFNTSQFSVGFWINVSSYTGTYIAGAVGNSLYTLFGPTAGPYQGQTNTFSAGIQFNATSNAIGTIQQSGFSTNTWYYYFCVYDGTQVGNSGRLKLWLNAIQYSLSFDSTVPSTPYNNNTTTKIGYGFNANLYPYFNGRIANLTYYNRVLSESEISQNYNATKAKFGL
jgi:hypothetical protein